MVMTLRRFLWRCPPRRAIGQAAIIANTVKGKGVSFMENQAKWHHGVPNDAQFATAMKELV